MLLADGIQLCILLVLVITAAIALWELRQTRKIHKETLLWNKKNKTIDTLNDFRKLKPIATRTKFAAYFKKPGTPIPLTEILQAIEENPNIRSEIIEYLNHH